MGDAADRAVVECALHHVGVLAIQIGVHHSLGPENEPDRGTRLQIGAFIGEIVIDGKSFVGMGRSEAAGDVHPFVDDIVPEPPAGLPQLRVAGRGGDIGHARIQIHRAHGVAADLGQFAHGDMRLGVGIRPPPVFAGIFTAGAGFDIKVVGLLATFVDEVPGEIEIALILSRAVELDQCELNFLVAAVAALLAFLGTEHGGDVVGVPAHHVEELAFACGVVVSHGTLDEVARAIEFMPVAQIGPAFGRGDDSEMGVQVAVRLLGFGDQLDHTIDKLFQIGIAMVDEAVGDGLDPLADVRVPEDVGFVWLAGFPLELEGVDAAGLFALLVLDRQGGAAIDFHQAPPEAAVDLNLSQWCAGVSIFRCHIEILNSFLNPATLIALVCLLGQPQLPAANSREGKRTLPPSPGFYL